MSDLRSQVMEEITAVWDREQRIDDAADAVIELVQADHISALTARVAELEAALKHKSPDTWDLLAFAIRKECPDPLPEGWMKFSCFLKDEPNRFSVDTMVLVKATGRTTLLEKEKP